MLPAPQKSRLCSFAPAKRPHQTPSSSALFRQVKPETQKSECLSRVQCQNCPQLGQTGHMKQRPGARAASGQLEHCCLRGCPHGGCRCGVAFEPRAACFQVRRHLRRLGALRVQDQGAASRCTSLRTPFWLCGCGPTVDLRGFAQRWSPCCSVGVRSGVSFVVEDRLHGGGRRRILDMQRLPESA